MATVHPYDPNSPNQFSVSDRKRNNRKNNAAFIRPTSLGSDKSVLWTIWFPSMPEQIELARTAAFTYFQQPNHPDGIAAYKYTEPLKIPLSFKVHAFDSEYCEAGPLSILDMAAKMQSLVLPDFVPQSFKLTPSGGDLNQFSPSGGGGNSEQALSNKIAQGTQTVTVGTLGFDINAVPLMWPTPVTVSLIGAGTGNPGVLFNGFLETNKVTLMGPWLEGSGGEFNLPSAAQFDFTVVHNPGYNGSVTGLTALEGMPSRAIAAYLYNTSFGQQTRDVSFLGDATGRTSSTR